MLNSLEHNVLRGLQSRKAACSAEAAVTVSAGSGFGGV